MADVSVSPRWRGGIDSKGKSVLDPTVRFTLVLMRRQAMLFRKLKKAAEVICLWCVHDISWSPHWQTCKLVAWLRASVMVKYQDPVTLWKSHIVNTSIRKVNHNGQFGPVREIPGHTWRRIQGIVFLVTVELWAQTDGIWLSRLVWNLPEIWVPFEHKMIKNGWWFGTWLLFSHILGME